MARVRHLAGSKYLRHGTLREIRQPPPMTATLVATTEHKQDQQNDDQQRGGIDGGLLMHRSSFKVEKLKAREGSRQFSACSQLAASE